MLNTHYPLTVPQARVLKTLRELDGEHCPLSRIALESRLTEGQCRRAIYELEELHLIKIYEDTP